MTGRAVVAGLAGVVLTLLAVPVAAPGDGGLSIAVDALTTAMGPDSSSQTPATAPQCASGSTLVGGGVRLVRTADSSLPTNGLKVNGTIPSSSSGAAVANGAADPSSWTALGGFAAVGETGDTVTGYALCASGGPAHTTVVSVNGPTVAATDMAVTATCPGGTSLVGGGGMSNNATTQPSFKIAGSFPSSAAGVPSSNGAASPQSWTAVGAAGGVGGFSGNGSNTTTAFAICATDQAVQTTVTRADLADNPSAATTAVTFTTTCPAGQALLGGGVLADGSAPGLDGGTPQQGVHLRGSYPSDAAGAPVASGAVDPTSWSVIVQSGGQVTPGTDTHAFGLCAAASSAAAAGGGGPAAGGGSPAGSPTPAGASPTGSAAGGSAGGASPAGTSAAVGAVDALALKQAVVSPGEAGSVTVGSGPTAAVVGWSKAGLAAASVTLSARPEPALVSGKGKAARGTVAVLVGVRAASGKVLKRFDSPLDLCFAGAAGNVVPAYSSNGKGWTRIPRLAASAVPAGYADGWYRDRLGTLHVLTRHPTAFALLDPGGKLLAAPLAVGYAISGEPTLASAGKLALTVQATRPARLTVTLTRAGRTLRSWPGLSAGGNPRKLELELPALAAGRYRLTVAGTAGNENVRELVPLRVA